MVWNGLKWMFFDQNSCFIEGKSSSHSKATKYADRIGSFTGIDWDMIELTNKMSSACLQLGEYDHGMNHQRSLDRNVEVYHQPMICKREFLGNLSSINALLRRILGKLPIGFHGVQKLPSTNDRPSTHNCWMGTDRNYEINPGEIVGTLIVITINHWNATGIDGISLELMRNKYGINGNSTSSRILPWPIWRKFHQA